MHVEPILQSGQGLFDTQWLSENLLIASMRKKNCKAFHSNYTLLGDVFIYMPDYQVAVFICLQQ